MLKRGQITIFVILGIVLVVIVVLLFTLRREILPKNILPTQTVSLQDHVEDCIRESGNNAINLVSKQGGEINPGFYQMFQGNKVEYLCYTSNNLSSCFVRQPFLQEHIENEINNYVTNNIKQCIDLNLWKDNGYSVSAGNMDVRTTIGRYDTIIILEYPVTITKGDVTEAKSRFSYTSRVPLGRLIEVSDDIVNSETVSGVFYPVPYMLRNKGEVEIIRFWQGDSKIYRLNLKNGNYIFQFAVRGSVIP